LAGIEDKNPIFLGFQDFSEGLFLPQDPLRKEHQFLFGLFPEFFPTGSFDLDLSDRIRRKVPVFAPVITNEKELHERESF
jgi:hypothetical protein